MAMGDLARQDEYGPPDDPWARAVRAAGDIEGAPPPAPPADGGPQMGSLLGMAGAGEVAQAVGEKYGKALDYYVGMPQRMMQGVTSEVPGQWSEGDEARQQQLLAERYQWAPQTAFGMVFDPAAALGAWRTIPHGALGSGAGSRIIQPAREAPGVAGASVGRMGDLADPFPWATGPERPQGNWMVRHDTGEPVLGLSGRGEGFSSSSTGVPAAEAQFEIRNSVSPANPKTFSIEELQRRNAALILAGHDRMMGGGELLGVGGKTFRKPVPLEAGANYPALHEGKVLLPEDPNAAVLFANQQGPATKFVREAQAVSERGYDPYLAGVLMNKMGGDSSKQMARTAYQAARAARPSDALAEKIDAAVQGELNTLKGAPLEPYPGLKSRKLEQWLEDTGGAYRAAFTKGLDRKAFVQQGMPDVGELRVANTNPLLLNTPTGSVGRLIGQMRPEAGTLTADLHSTYPTSFFGQRGEIGGLQGSVPFHVIAPDVHRGLVRAGPANQFSNVPAYYSTLEMPKGVSRVQPVTQEVVDNVSNFFRKYPQGWAVGGVPAMGVLAAQDRYDEQ